MGSYFFIKEYVLWHYGQAIADIVEVWRNFFWFGYHFFSMPLLLKTLFSPFRRLREKGGNLLHLEILFENILANIIGRIVGFLLRSFVFALGVFYMILASAAFVIALILWIMLPFLIMILLSGIIFFFVIPN